MSLSSCTITTIGPQHNPNEGRVIINDNFRCLSGAVASLEAIASTGDTMVSSGTNISVTSTTLSGIPNYTVSVIDEPVFVSSYSTSLSGGTIFSGGTDLSDLLANITPPGGVNYNEQFTVTAVGTDAYTGTSSPSITGYSTSAIYLTQFSNSNTISGVTLDIDSNGVLNIMKGTDEGLGPLEIGEIQTGVTYFLTYDGTQFQFFTSSPEGTIGTYTNLNPTTTAVGGLAVGTSFSSSTWQSIFDIMFYPTLVPNFSTFVMRATPSTASTQSQTLEVGDSVSGGTRVFTWLTSNSSYVQPNTIKIYNVTGGNILISSPSSGIANDSVESITGLTNVQKVIPTSHIWRIYGTRTNLSTFYTNFQVNWRWRRMYGVSTATTITTSDDVNAFSGTGTLTTTIAGTYSQVGAGYKYFFVPTTFTSPTLFKDNSTQLSVAMADSTDNAFFSGTSGSYSFGTASVTNQFGIAQNYRVYRTRNFLNGDITIIVT